MQKHYVYELINLYGSVEDVGETTRPKWRLYQHTKVKPEGGHGKYYGRQDLVMNIVDTFDNRSDALKLETELKLSYGLEPTERNRNSKNGRKAGLLYGGKNAEVVLVYKKDGSFVGEYQSQRHCAIALQLSHSKVCEVSNGKLPQTKGYLIKFKDDTR
jgi:predicted GIY-YIG superfamily endonuclease